MNNKTDTKNIKAELKEIGSALAVIMENDKEFATKDFEFLPQFLGFQGHFPNKAVLPAIVQIMMAQLTIEEKLGSEVKTSQVMQAKFTMPVEPNQKTRVKVAEIKENLWQCSIFVQAEGEIEINYNQCAQFRIRCEKN